MVIGGRWKAISEGNRWNYIQQLNSMAKHKIKLELVTRPSQVDGLGIPDSEISRPLFGDKIRPMFRLLLILCTGIMTIVKTSQTLEILHTLWDSKGFYNCMIVLRHKFMANDHTMNKEVNRTLSFFNITLSTSTEYFCIKPYICYKPKIIIQIFVRFREEILNKTGH